MTPKINSLNITNTKVSHHLLLCGTSNNQLCCDRQTGEACWTALKKLVRELDLENLDRSNGIVLRSKIDCLRICREGPILLIWPDGIWYKDVYSNRIERIIESHIIHGNPIKEWVLQETPLYITTRNLH